MFVSNLPQLYEFCLEPILAQIQNNIFVFKIDVGSRMFFLKDFSKFPNGHHVIPKQLDQSPSTTTTLMSYSRSAAISIDQDDWSKDGAGLNWFTRSKGSPMHKGSKSWKVWSDPTVAQIANEVIAGSGGKFSTTSLSVIWVWWIGGLALLTWETQTTVSGRQCDAFGNVLLETWMLLLRVPTTSTLLQAMYAMSWKQYFLTAMVSSSRIIPHKAEMFEVWARPSNSSNLSPAELLWDVLDKQIPNHGAHTFTNYWT